MDPITGAALISAGSSVFGGLLGSAGQAATNAQSYAMQLQAEQFNAQQQTIQNKFTYDMSSTAYQRQVADMKAAGLNPILGVGSGGAPVGGGSAASIGSGPSLGNPGAALQKGVADAGASSMAVTAMQAQKAQAEKDKTSATLNDAATDRTKAEIVKTNQDTRTSESAQRLNDAAAANKAVEAVRMAADANSANAVARVNTRVAEDTEKYGDSPVSKGIAGVIRMIKTGLGTADQVAPTARQASDNLKQDWAKEWTGDYPNGIRGYDTPRGVLGPPTSLKLPAKR